MTASFTTGYFDDAVFGLGAVIDQAVKRLTAKGVPSFDTLVGTGFSGGIVVPALALRLGVKFALVRKETDDSHHGPGKVVGEIGDRWIFVDDFVSSGKTRSRVMRKVELGAEYNDAETPTFVGQYLYGKWAMDEQAGVFTPAEEVRT